MARQTINAAGLALVKHFEGCLKPVRGTDLVEAYKCPAGVWTIGWGTTEYPSGEAVRPGDRITRGTADRHLDYELEEKAEAVRRLVKVALTGDQFSALVSFAYNVGAGALEGSTLLRRLNAGDYAGAAAQFGRWNRGGGRVLAGLTRRREAERRLFEGKHPAVA
jgi:lysozyme